MNKKGLIIAFFIAVSAIVNAENTPKSIVTSFGKALSAWCQSGDISYRIELEQLCNGVKKCRVEDKIHADYQIKNGLRDYETFVLDSYLNMFQTLMAEGIRFYMSNITVETQDHYPGGQTLTFITADIRVSGKLNYTVKDLFLVRDDKISGIYNYSSQLGFQHLNGSLIETLKKEELCWSDIFRRGYAIVANKEDKCGLIDRKGNIIVPFIWDGLSYLGGDFVWGFNYKSDRGKSCSYDLRYGGKEVPFYRAQTFIVGREDSVVTFSEGYAVVFNADGKYAYLKEDDYLYNNINYIYDEAGRFSEGYAYVKLEGRGAIINKRFEIVIQDDNDYKICSRFDEGLASVQNLETNKYGFINTEGELVIPCVYDEVDRFYEGLCEVRKNDIPSQCSYYQTTQSGFINRKGKLVIPFSFVHCLSGFEDGYAVVSRIGGNGLLESTLLGADGNPLSGFSWYENIRFLSGGLVRFEKNEKYGFLNSMGNVVIPPIYESASEFTYNARYACVGKVIGGKHKYGCINTDGVLVIPYMYDSPFEFEDGVALVEKDNRLGLIDVYGNSTFFATRSKN